MSGLAWWHVYLFTRLDILNKVFGVGFVVLLVSLCFAGFLIGYSADMRDIYKEGSASYISYTSMIRASKSYIKFSSIVTLIFLLGLITLPSQKEAAAIYLLPKLVNSEAMKEAEKLPKTFVTLLDSKMHEWISDSIEEQPKTKENK